MSAEAMAASHVAAVKGNFPFGKLLLAILAAITIMALVSGPFSGAVVRHSVNHNSTWNCIPGERATFSTILLGVPFSHTSAWEGPCDKLDPADPAVQELIRGVAEDINKIFRWLKTADVTKYLEVAFQVLMHY